MRGIALGVVLAVSALAGPALAEDVYSWKDSQGVEHFGNAPTTGAKQTGMAYAPDTFESTADDEAEASAADQGGFVQSDDPASGADRSAGDDLRRLRIGKQLKSMSQRVTAIDGELAKLASIRTQYAAGTPETGGLGTNAAGYLSPEEKALVAEREQLLKDQEGLEKELAGLGSGSNAAEQEILVDDAAAVASEPEHPVE